MKVNINRKKSLYIEKYCFEKSHSYCSTCDRTAELSICLEDPVSTKIVWCELHKSNIHGRAAIAKPLITENNDQMRKRWCHNRKTSTSDNGNDRMIWSDECLSLCSVNQKELNFGEHSRKPEIRNAWFQQWNTGKDLWWFGQQYRGTVLSRIFVTIDGVWIGEWIYLLLILTTRNYK
jgi:hypothetical protein